MFMPVESVWNAGAADLPLLDLRLFPVSCPRCKIKKRTESNQLPQFVSHDLCGLDRPWICMLDYRII